jgi:thiol:disulfide interchange protein DsbG
MKLLSAVVAAVVLVSPALALAEVSSAEGAGLMERLSQSAYVQEGAAHAKQVVYAFSDPNCPYCSLMWRALQPYERVGLQVRWVQVAVLAPDSAGKAATLLKSPDGGLAMAANEEHFDYSSSSGGILPVPVTPAIHAALKNNLTLMKDLGLVGTPAMVFQDSQSGKVEIKAGMPKVSGLGWELGLPSQPEPDPMLEHFR